MGPLFHGSLLLELSSALGDISLPITSPRPGVLGSSPSWLVPLTVLTPLLQHSTCFLPGPFHAIDQERSSITPGLLKILGRSKITFSCHNRSYSSSQVISQTLITTVPLPMLTSFPYPRNDSQLLRSSKALDHNAAKSYRRLKKDEGLLFGAKQETC